MFDLFLFFFIIMVTRVCARIVEKIRKFTVNLFR